MKIKLIILSAPIVGAIVFCGWFFSLTPTGKADWDLPFLVMPKAEFSADGKSVTVENVRDFHYRTEKDYDVRYRTETYDLDSVKTVDYSVTYWNGSTLFGHVLLSFGFEDGRHLVFSSEARLTKGHVYELLPGFFRQYELIFICATETDALLLRTNHRRYENSSVYLYPTRTTPQEARILLTDLLKRANVLREKPEFYNGLFYNCFSTLGPSLRKIGIDYCGPWHGLLNGLSDKWGWERGWLNRTRPGESFEDYRHRHFINPLVEKLVDPPDYSQLIRSKW